MRKSLALLLAIFLTASCVMAANPAFSSTEVTENTWVTKAPMHQTRGYLGVAAVNGRIYAIGGSTQQGSSPDDLKGGAVGTNEEYSPATNTWTSKAPMLTPRYFFATAVYQNKIYCIGGYTSNGTATGANEAYDPVTGTWATKASIPTALSGYSSTVVDNKIYVIDSNLNQIYNSETDTWSQGASAPSRIGCSKAGATNGVNAPKLIYVLGQDYSFSEPPYVNCVYDPANDTWTTGAAVPTKRTGFGVAVVNDVLYAIGGSTETFDMYWNSRIIMYATNEMYTPFGYGTVPPNVQIVSPENMTYETSNVSLALTVNKQASWLGYSVDGGETVTVAGNATLGGLANGVHNVTVYAKDTFGNTGVSETVYFTVMVPFPATMIIAPIASMVVVGAAVVLYFRKRNGSKR